MNLTGNSPEGRIRKTEEEEEEEADRKVKGT
jgi:hypothetical protein